MSDYHHDLTPDDLAFLIATVGQEHVSVAAADKDQHASDESFHKAHQPAAVVWPSSVEEISAILRYANQHRIPITPWGAGTSMEGNPIPLCGGIALDTFRLDRILAVRAGDFQADVQAGIRYKDMNTALARHGLFFAPDPGANASIGGMIANNAAGTRTPRYGATRDNVLRLEVVLASGEVIHTGTHATKTSSGYDLVHLFVGSEGTLGVVTKATLKLAPLPEKFSAVIAAFPTSNEATRAVLSIMGSGFTPAALEFLCPVTVRTLNATGEFTLPEHPILLMEFHSALETALKEELDVVEGLCKEEGCLSFMPGLGRAERNRLWEVRHRAYETLVRLNPGLAILIADVAVPVSKYPQIVAVAEQALAIRDVQGYLLGHAGDGNLHPLILYTPGDPDSYALTLAANQEIVEAAIAMGGTATGEHGVGIGKRQFMALEHGGSLNAMRAIKAALDPNGILNPGKIFEPEGPQSG
jgi:D-lactate dehydrogenase (cytochrome)